jgi:WD40 repeat protein
MFTKPKSYPGVLTEIKVQAYEDIHAGDKIYILPKDISYRAVTTSISGIDSYITAVSCSANGSIIACTKSVPCVFRRSGYTLTPISLSSNPSGTVVCVAVSPSGRYLAIGTNSSPYLFCYELVEGTYQLRSLSANPAAAVYGATFLTDDLLAIASPGASPYVYAYTTGTTFTQYPSTTPTSHGSSSTISVTYVTDTSFVVFPYAGSTSTTYATYALDSGSLIRVLSSSSANLSGICSYNPLLDVHYVMRGSPAYHSFGKFSSSITTYYSYHGNLTVNGAAPTLTGFILACSNGIYELSLTGPYNAGPNTAVRKLPFTSSSCYGFAATQDLKTFFTSVNGVLTIIELSNVPFAVRAAGTPYFNFMTCYALEDIPAGGIGTVGFLPTA